MASATALMTGNRRRVSSAVATQVGRIAKLAEGGRRRPNSGGGAGARPPIVAPTRPVRVGRNGNGGPIVQDPNETVIFNFDPFPGGGGGFPGLPGQPTQPPGGGGIYAGLCDMLPDYLQAACRQLAGGLPGGGGSGSGGSGFTPMSCPSGTIQVGDKCVALGDAFPGGDPFTFGAGGTPVAGAFGLPAQTPLQQQKTVLRCGPAMVLGRDNLCYPKAVLPPRSMWRKWKRAPRAPVTAGDMKAIRKAAAAQGRVKRLAKNVGFSCKKR